MKFNKVSFEQFKEDMYSTVLPKAVFEDCDIEDIYNELVSPKRATVGSAGYDFFAPFGFDLEVGETIKLPTGFNIQLDMDKVLACVPRSGHGFKYRVQLDNTIGIIDADYINSDNEGHMWVKLTNDGHEGKTLHVNCGEAYMQGLILQYFTVEDDDTDGVRNGGFGSTSEPNKVRNSKFMRFTKEKYLKKTNTTYSEFIKRVEHTWVMQCDGKLFEFINGSNVSELNEEDYMVHLSWCEEI